MTDGSPGRGSAAAILLEQMQEAAFAEAGLTPSAFDASTEALAEKMVADGASVLGLDDAATVEMQASIAEQFRAAVHARPTRFEDVPSFILLTDLAKDIEESAVLLDWTLPRRPLFGTLPLRQLNAMAFRVPGSADHVIAFQHGVFGFMNLMAKGFAAALPVDEDAEGVASFSTDIDQIRERVASAPDVVARMGDFLSAYVYEGDPHQAKQYFLGGPAGTLSAILRRSAETFLLGHEYGHLLGLHLEHSATARPLPGTAKADVVAQAWDDEFEADFFGLILAAHTMARRRYDLALAYAGVDLVFTSIELVEHCLAVALHGDVSRRSVSDTHPPALQRRAMLREGLSFLSDDAEQVNGARSLATQLEVLADIFWDFLEAAFMTLHAEGEQASSIWARRT